MLSQAIEQKKIGAYAGLLIGAWLLGLAGESIYSPAMPSMAHSLMTSEALIKQTITYFIMGKTISMLVCSPIAEGFSRRQFALFGLLLFALSGLICAMAPTIQVLLAGRLLQGVGCSITILMGRAIVNDNFTSRYAAKVFSYIFTGNAIGIFILPVLGGYLATWLSWRWIFIILTGYGLLIFSLMWWFLPSNHSKTNFNMLRPRVIAQNYRTIITNHSFWGFLLCVAFMMAGEKAYTTSAAFLFINTLGFSKVSFGYLSALMWSAHLSGTLLAGWLAVRAGIDRSLTMGVAMVSVSGLLMVFAGFFGLSSMYLFIMTMFFYMLGTGFIIVSAAVGIVRPFPTLIGFATAFAMALEFGIATGASFVISHHAASVIIVEKAVGMMGLLTLCSWGFLCRKSKRS